MYGNIFCPYMYDSTYFLQAFIAVLSQPEGSSVTCTDEL